MFIYFYLIFHNYVNRLKVEKLEAMAKLHTHYITNAQKELKYAYAGVSEDDFQSSIRTALNRSDDFDEDERDDFSDDDDDDDDDNGGNDGEMGNQDSNNQKTTEIEKWVNINDLELKRLLSIEVNVVIEPQPLPVINHGSNVFDIEATVDKILGSKKS
jgi:hypothetical protein